MPAPLRSIAVHVTEPETGAFQWALAELCADHTWTELQSAEASCSTYKEAVANGLLALQALIPDLDTGPRAASADQHRRSGPNRGAGRVRSEEDEEPILDDGTSPSHQSVFGFGLAN